MSEQYDSNQQPQQQYQPEQQQYQPQYQDQQQYQQYQQQQYQQPYQQQYQQPYQQQQYQQPYQQQYQQPYQQQPYQQPYQQQYAAAPAKSATTLIILSVLEFLFCGGLFAIIPLVFAIQANSAYNMGDIAGGDAKAKTAKTALIIILCVGILAYVALFALGGIAALSS